MRIETSKRTAWVRLIGAVIAAGLLTGCFFKSAESAKKEYLEKGNDYFEKGKFSEASLMYQKALQKDRRYAEAWYRFSLLQLRQQQFSEAVSSLRKVVEIEPNHPDANGKLMDIYAAAWATDRRNRDALLTELEAVVAGLRKVNPNGFDTLRGEAVLGMINRKPEVAVEKLQQALQIQPKRLDAAQGYAQALVAVGKQAEAEAFAKKFVEDNKQAGPMYDLLIAFAASRKDLAEVERLMQSKVANMPLQVQHRLALARLYAAQRLPDKVRETLDPLVNRTKDFPLGKLAAGDFYAATGNAAEAEKLYQQGWSGTTERALYGLRLAELRIRERKLKEAESFTDEVIKIDGNNREGRALKALLLLETGDPSKRADAIKRLNDLATNDPRNSALKFHLGRAQLINGDADAALSSFQQAVRLNQDNLLARQALAETYFRKGDVQQAIAQTSETLALQETYLPARVLRADAYLSSSALDNARADVDAAVKQAPDLPEVKLLQAKLALTQGNFAAAEALYRERFNLNDPRAFEGYVRALASQNKLPQAMEIVAQQIASRPKEQGLRVLAAEVAIRQKDLAGAAGHLKAGIEIAPNQPQSSPLYSRLASVTADLGDVDGAIKILNQARALNPKNVSALFQLGQLYERKKDDQGAMEAYRSVLAVTQNQPIALNNLAYKMADRNQDLDTALNYARQARQLMPNDVNVADTLGYVFLKKNLNDSAIELYKEIQAKNAHTAITRLHMGMAYAQKGDKAEARKQLASALQSKPAKEHEAQIREWLSKVS